MNTIYVSHKIFLSLNMNQIWESVSKSPTNITGIGSLECFSLYGVNSCFGWPLLNVFLLNQRLVISVFFSALQCVQSNLGVSSRHEEWVGRKRFEL